MSSTDGAEPVINRTMITISIMLASMMTYLDSTIANVALPDMAGSVSASADQISWVLTSYIIAAAIMTPVTAWLSGRFGAKRLFIIAIVGFTVASALCGAAQSLPQIVLFRVLQGMFGAIMQPLSQSVLLDIYSIEERGSVMSLWSMGAVIAPIVGPILGGWLTDINWRWVFYINLPVGVISLIGVLTFMPGQHKSKGRRFDMMGFGLLSVALAALQLVLDRGQSQNWFEATEIQIEAAVGGLALTLFAIHTVTTEHPFLPIGLLYDRNFMTSIVIYFTIGCLMFSVLALLPPMVETLLGYPVIYAGLVVSPRGLGSMISILLAGRLIGKVDDRLLVFFGLTLLGAAFWGMTRFSLYMNVSLIAWSGFTLGIGTGFVFIPTTVLAFATLKPELRADAAGVSSLMRNLGNSAGISILETILTRNTQIAHARLVETLRPDNPLARAPYLAAPFNLKTPVGLASLDGEVTRQATMVAYIDVYHALLVATVFAIPIVFLLRPAKTAVRETVVIE